jgi:hypothetical protein
MTRTIFIWKLDQNPGFYLELHSTKPSSGGVA